MTYLEAKQRKLEGHPPRPADATAYGICWIVIALLLAIVS